MHRKLGMIAQFSVHFSFHKSQEIPHSLNQLLINSNKIKMLGI
jgi:hypothetical protein